MGGFRGFLTFFLASFLSFDEAEAQIAAFPYVERFDSIAVPALPAGWTTTTNRLSSGDFFSTTSSPRSAPNALQSTNSAVTQSLASPTFSFVNRVPNILQFHTSRSSTHTSGFLVEASVDGGSSFPIALGDTIRHPGTTGYVLTGLQLPASMAQQPAVRFRWRIVGGSGGTTGTFRIDDVSISVFTSFDLGLSELAVEPPNPTILTSMTLLCTIRNHGISPANGYMVNFSLDANRNGIAEPSEVFVTWNGPIIDPNDSLEVSGTHPPLPPGDYSFIVSIAYNKDEISSNNESRLTINVGVPPGSVAVSEIMYGPFGDEPEWVEMLNTTTSVINLKNWKISDSNASSKTLLTPSDLFLDPMSYALVAKDSLFASLHPGIGVPVIIANFAALNNTSPDAVVLSDHRGMTIDSVFYSPSWGGQDGRSLERIDELESSNDPANWTTSVDSLGRTPGRLNSVAKLEYDLAIKATTVLGVLLTIEVKNVGRLTAQGFTLRLFSDLNRDGIPEAHEEIVSLISAEELQSGSSRSLFYEWSSAPPGEVSVLIRIEFAPDLRQSNNSATVFVVSRFAKKSLVVNEIFYEPLPGQNEWVEFYHRGDLPVNLQHWSFGDRPTGSGTRNMFSVSAISRTVGRSEYVIVAAESTILDHFPGLESSPGVHLIILNRTGGLSFGNDGDDVVLYDLTGSTIDSVSYSPAWHNPDVADTRGRSLERINPEIESNDRRNWNTSARMAGGTPGFQNSLHTTSLPAGTTVAITPNPFSPDGDGFEDVCIVRYHLPFTSSIIRIKIFDLRGRLIRMLADGEPAGFQGELIWDGFDDQKRRARVGPHIVLVEAVGNQGGIISSKTVVVVATKL